MSRSMLYCLSGLVLLPGALACADSSPRPDTPAPGAAPAQPAASAATDSLPVRIEEQVRQPTPADSVPVVRFASGAGEIAVQWTLRSGPCMLAEGAASRSADSLIVRIVRRGNPVALCEAGEVVYSYDARIGGLAAGQYHVTLVDAPLREPSRVAGTGTVDVRPGGT